MGQIWGKIGEMENRLRYGTKLILYIGTIW